MYFRLQGSANKLHEGIKAGSDLNWWSETEEQMKKFELDIDHLGRLKKEKRKIILESKIREKFLFSLLVSGGAKSKIRYLLHDSYGRLNVMKPYLMKLNRFEASAIFKARCRMFEAKANFKGKHNALKCRLCESKDETQDHILYECLKNESTRLNGFTKENLFRDNNIVRTKKIARILILTSDLLDAQL